MRRDGILIEPALIDPMDCTPCGHAQPVLEDEAASSPPGACADVKPSAARLVLMTPSGNTIDITGAAFELLQRVHAMNASWLGDANAATGGCAASWAQLC